MNNQTDAPLSVSYEDVTLAAQRLKGVANRTPVLTSRTANRNFDGELYFKCENLQRAGAFKFRGAYNILATMNEEWRRRGVISYSSGNHAQALALAGRLQGIATTIVMPKDAPQVKLRAAKEYGAEIVFYDRYCEDREEIGRRIAAERGAALISSHNHPQIIAGQATATLELLEDAGQLDFLFVGLGGGSSLAGAAIAAKARSSGCRVIGVEPEEGDDGRQSFRRGEIVHIPVPKSVADGALMTHLGSHTFPIIRRLVDDIVTVSDAMLIGAMRFFAERMKLVVEPTGCLGAAAVFSKAFHGPGKRIGILITGGNVDPLRFAQLLGGQA